MRTFLIGTLVAVWAGTALAQDTPDPPMDFPRMAEIAGALDPDASVQGNAIQLTIDDIPVLIITDPLADRMRAMVPIRSAAGIEADEMRRLMQANFDSALDARYAVANGRLWGVFIHPMRALERDQLISGIAQTVNIAKTYGTLYSGGAMQFGGGDSPGLQRQLIDRLLEKGQDI
ncbi:MAG: hypothetical protein AAFV31_05335 [Pseudomonadota bacterium]